MPLKDVNLEWDLEDPNKVVPAHDEQNMKMDYIGDEIQPARDIEEQTPAKGDEHGRVEHIDQSPQKV